MSLSKVLSSSLLDLLLRVKSQFLIHAVRRAGNSKRKLEVLLPAGGGVAGGEIRGHLGCGEGEGEAVVCRCVCEGEQAARCIGRGRDQEAVRAQERYTNLLTRPLVRHGPYQEGRYSAARPHVSLTCAS